MRQVLYIPHGGGPLPLLGDPAYARLASMLRSLNAAVAQSRAIVVVTAHWECDQVGFCTADKPGMLYDYYGFPAAAYRIRYPAPGAAALAATLASRLAKQGIETAFDSERGFDHGTFVPMTLIRPEADIPILQMSLLSSLDPGQHWAVGQAIGGLLEDDTTLLGSGFSFHNLQALRGGYGEDPGPAEALANAFHHWLDEVVCTAQLTSIERRQQLSAWAEAPGARFCHPREEHLLPLHVCAGAADAAGMSAEKIFGEAVKGYRTSGYRWH